MEKALKSINVEIGQRVKERRLALGLTRDSFAKRSGYSPSFVQDVELGRSGLSAESIRDFSMALNISTDSLLFGKTTESFKFIEEKLEAMPPEKRECLMRLIDTAIEFGK